jgi:hypothetical protein
MTEEIDWQGLLRIAIVNGDDWLIVAVREVISLQKEVAQMAEFISDMPSGDEAYDQWLEDMAR